MKLFILSDDLSGSGPVWMNIFWPHYTAYVDSVPVVLMSTPFIEPLTGRVGSRWQSWREKRDHEERLCKLVRDQYDPDGPNLLVVWALNTRDIMRARLLEQVWDLFDVKVLWILDTVQPAETRLDMVGRFDLIASICGDIGRDFEAATSKPVIYMPPHTDVLRYGCADDYRPLDLVIVGRREQALYGPIHFHFNEPGKRRLSVDMVTRTKNFSGTTEEECQLLMSAYSKAKVSLCFEPSKAHPRFRGYSPLTERWPHSWASGCAVVGRRPTGRGVAEQLDWPEATIELPSAPEDAIAYLETLFDDAASLRRIRHRNVAEAALRHDSRHRFLKLLNELDMPVPENLAVGLKRLDAMANDLYGKNR